MPMAVLIGSGHQGINPSREAISILSGKYKRFTFVNPVSGVYLSDFINSVAICLAEFI